MEMKKCENCETEGGILSVRNRSFTFTNNKILCKNCYTEIRIKEKKITSKQYSNEKEFARAKVDILRRMDDYAIDNFCHEKSIPLKTMKKRYSRAGGQAHWDRYEYVYTFEELVSSLVENATLDEVIDYANRRCEDIQIDDILTRLDEIEAENESLTDKISQMKEGNE